MKLLRAIQFILVIFSLAHFCACGDSDSLPSDLDFDGIWDIDDKYPNDTDNDGITNDQDPDDDSDGVPDVSDAFPYNPTESADTDGDGIGNNADPDDDNDGVADASDRFSLDPKEWSDYDGDGVGDNADPDDDNDGIFDSVDSQPFDVKISGDIDGDGIDNLMDADIDGDGYPNDLEVREGADPLNKNSSPPDADSDGLTDNQESILGTDQNSADTDSDGLSDPLELEIKSNPKSADSDDDGINDKTEAGADYKNLSDYDRDGVPDIVDYQILFEFTPKVVNPPAEQRRNGCSWNNSGDKIFVADAFNNSIKVFGYDGQKLTEFTSGSINFLRPNDVAADASGNIYVADTENNQIQVFDNGYNYSKNIGALGHNLGEFSQPRGLFVWGGDLYVADTTNQRVQIIDLAGANPVRSFGSSGSNLGKFNNPKDLVVDSNGAIYVADHGNSRIQKFTSSGEFISQINAQTLGLGESAEIRPMGIGIDSADNIYIADEVEARIVVINSGGKIKSVFGLFGNSFGEYILPSCVDLSIKGKILIVDRYRGQVF